MFRLVTAGLFSTSEWCATHNADWYDISWSRFHIKHNYRQYHNVPYFSQIYTTAQGRDAHIPGARPPWRLNYLRWHLIFVDPQYGTYFKSHFWHLKILRCLLHFWTNLCTPGVNYVARILHYSKHSITFVKGIGKVHPRTGHEGQERERYSSTLSLTSAIDGVGGQRHDPAALPPVKTRYPMYRGLDGPQCWSPRPLYPR
jgi:hypothetical protein